MKSFCNSLKKTKIDARYLRRLGMLAVFCLFLFCSEALQKEVCATLLYVAQVLVPAVFPFAVLAGLYAQQRPSVREARLAKAVARILRLSPIALSALPLGMLAGFPLGGQYTIDLYNKGYIKKEEADRLFAMVNTPSLAFVVAGVGQGMMHSLAAGILLYTATVGSAYAIGVWEGRRVGIPPQRPTRSENDPPREQAADRPLSVLIREATVTTLYVAGYVVFFGALRGVIGALIPSTVACSLLYLLLEVTGACASASALPLSTASRMGFLGFALGFGGVCVGMQSERYLRDGGLSVKRYYGRKLAAGLLCAIASYLLSLLFL